MSVSINIIRDGSRTFLRRKRQFTTPRPNRSLGVGWIGARVPRLGDIHPSPNIIIFILILILILLTTSLVDGSCRPHTCNGLDIKYPFWIPGLQEPQCGSARFNITCNNSSAPVIKINGDDYIIKDIFYNNASFLLAHSTLLDADCPVPRRNFSVAGTPFSYGPATTDLFFFYNCTAPYDRETYSVDCASNATRHAFAVFHVELLPRWNYSVRACQAPVNAPVEANSIAQLLKMNYTVILNKGFVLQWKPNHTVTGKKINLGLKIGIGIGAVLISAIAMCIIFSIFHHHHYKTSYATKPSPSHEYPPPYPDLGKDLQKAGIHIFDFLELEEATHDFDPKMEVGDGGYGAVYKGKLPDGRVVAVKRLYQHHYRRMEQFLNEVEILARLRHQNLVALYGCTSCHSKELLLVYEYIPNGTLAEHLHGERAKPGCLLWTTRLSIAIETASALAYLHASDVIHRDIKSCNILLDDNFVVKVADFGLSRLLPADATHVSTAPQGTPGYVDPEYGEYYQLTEKSDVYSFGVVLIELISSKLAVDITRHRHEINLSSMAINKIQNHAWCDLVDPYLGFESDCEVRRMIVGVAELAFRCLQNQGEMRPDMQDVLDALEEIQSKDYNTDVMDQE